MATASDAAALRSMWKLEDLGAYKGRWIAFRNGQVLESSNTLSTLLIAYDTQVRGGDGPLFAYVTFTARA